MGRFSDYDPDEYVMPDSFWRHNVEATLRGRRGQATLRRLRDALLALPEPKLLRDQVVDPARGMVCAIGALALQQTRVQAPDAPYLALEEQLPDQEDPNLLADTFADLLHCSMTLAFEIMQVNDSPWLVEDDEQRYRRVLAWVDEQIDEDTR